MKKVYLAATGENEGKTTVALGLLRGLERRLGAIGFFKPVGQHAVRVGDRLTNEDSLLADELHGFGVDLEDMSPIHVGRGFTRRFLADGDAGQLERRILEAFGRVAADRAAVVIEGTGHTGVGSVLGLSNARVAEMLGAPAVLVSRGGIGQPIDRVALNHSLFERHGVPLIGVVLNKVRPDKMDAVREYAGRGLERMGIRLLGVLPLQRMLRYPTIEQVMDHLGAELLSGGENLGNRVSQVVVGDMSPHLALSYFDTGVLAIVRGDREDLILSALGSSMVGFGEPHRVSGLLLTGDIRPHPDVVDIIRNIDVPVILSAEDSYTVGSRVHGLIVKTRSKDHDKVSLIEDLVEEHLDIDHITEWMS